MTIKEIKVMLKEADFQVFYDHAPNGTKLPFITFNVRANNFFADDKVYYSFTEISISLYVSEKNMEAEKKIEGVLKKYGILWQKDESYMNDSKVFIEIYNCEV